MTGREQDEYRSLRDTIRERGTARICLFVAGIAAWAAATIATAALASTPLATLLPLLVLASAFEAIFALHVGVERIGRYIQVFYETSTDEQESTGQWEHTAMAFGRPAGAAAVDALFTVPFLLAAVFNLAPMLLQNPVQAELIFVGGAHALFVLRVIVARQTAAKQRGIDLARFTQLRDSRR
ncbi:MAG TPA: hypothetical protein VGJ29_04710 [Vicinamibacterales bacterium]